MNRRGLRVCGYDIPTQDKIPAIQALMSATGEGLALDIGCGTGYTTGRVFANRQTVGVDVHAPNLTYYRSTVNGTYRAGAPTPWCVVAQAEALPFQSGTFSFVLCSEVLEHLRDDETAVEELARVLTPEGRAVVTVPYTGIGFTSFLELCRIKTVHDFPGPEQHVRPGYDERTLGRLLARHGLELERHTYYLRVFSRLVTDLVSLAHLAYQRLIHHRTRWTWSEAAAAERGFAFRLYTWVFPLLWACSRMDRWLTRTRGFGLIAVIRKRPE